MATINVIAILLCVLYSAISVDYRTKLPSGYWQVSVGEFDQTRGDKLMAFADFNSDGFTDIASVDSLSSMVIAINIWSQNAGVFVRKELLTASRPVLSIITADMNFDGKPDVIYVENEEVQYNIKIIFVDGCPSSCAFTPLQDPDSLLIDVDPVQPFLLDLHGTKVPEIFFVRQGIRQHASVQNLALKSVSFDSHIYNPVNSEGFKTYPDIVYPTLSNHFASLVDVNGDCMADLVLISKNDTASFLEFYTNLKNGYLDQPKFIAVGSDIKSVSFADINFDGANDLILLYGNGTSTFLELHLNKFPSNAYHLCNQITEFPFDFEPLESGSLKKIQRLPIAGAISTDASMKFADLNLDGYADLVLSMLVDVDGTRTPSAQIYINTQCYGQQCGTYNPEYTIFANTSNLRYFSLSVPVTFNVTNVTAVAIFDLYEDGSPDLLMNQFVTKNVVGNVTYIVAILNNKQEDAFFTKILCLNGANVTTKVSAPLPGVCYEWVVTGLGGNYIPAVGTQGMQVSHRSLPLPYMMSGLGRTNNFIEDFYVGIPAKTTSYSRKWSPIVPNTQLIISPVQADPSKWKLSMKIQPTEKLKMVFMLTVLALILVGLMIYYYHRKQQIENKENLDSFYVALS